MGAPWGLNALSVRGNQGCIQIEMTDKNIKAQWHFTNLWYCSRLLRIQGFKVKPRGNFTISESSEVSAERRLSVEKTVYHVAFFLLCADYTLTYRVIKTVSNKNSWTNVNILCFTNVGGSTSMKVDTRRVTWGKKIHCRCLHCDRKSA